MSAAAGKGVMALAGVAGRIGGYRSDLFAHRDLARKVGQDRCFADVALGDPDRPNLQCLRVDPEVDLAPAASFGAAMFAGVPRTFALSLERGPVDQKVW